MRRKPPRSKPRRKQRLWREETLSRSRFEARLRRRNKFYDPNRQFLVQHKVRLNEGFSLKRIVPGISSVVAPSNLDFALHATETINFLVALRQEMLEGDKFNIRIDISALTEISLPAAVVLIAEVSRGLWYIGTKKKVSGNYPKADRARQILADIGFFAAVGARKPSYATPESDRVYVKTCSGNRTDGRYTRPFLALFEQVTGAPAYASKRLYEALLECMDNVRSHAYDSTDSTRPDTIGEWWLCGFADPLRRQFALVFYDLGLGIPTTIKRRRSIRFRSYWNFSDQRILKQAVMQGLSSLSSARRGTGLPSLREFVDIAPGGFLRVVSGTGDFVYERQRSREVSNQIAPGFAGSLIVWTIQGSGGAAGKVSPGAHELADDAEPVQLSFRV